MKKKIIVGLLVVVILATATYIQLSGQGVRMRIDNDKSVFYVNQSLIYPDKPSRFIISGIEYNRLFNGTKIVYRDRSSIKRETYINQNQKTVTEYRYTKYKNGPIIEDYYFYRGDTNSKEMFPVYHKVIISNGTGFFYRYTVDRLTGTGPKRKLNGETELSFGLKMKVLLHPNYRWAWIGWPYGSDSLSAQYKIESDYEIFNVRLFDPDVGGGYDIDIYMNGVNDSRNYELNTTAEINITSNCTDWSSCINLCIDIDHPEFGTNYICNPRNYFYNEFFNFVNSSSPTAMNFYGGDNYTHYVSVDNNAYISNITFTINGTSRDDNHSISFESETTNSNFLTGTDGSCYIEDILILSSNGDHQVSLWNVSDRSNPSFISNVSCADAFYLVCDDEFVYSSAANTDTTLYVINISDKENPSLISTYQDLDLVYTANMVKDGDLIYIASYFNDSVGILNISDPYNVATVSYFKNSSSLDQALFATIKGDFMYAGGYLQSKVVILNITDKSKIMQIAIMDDPVIEVPEYTIEYEDLLYILANAAFAIYNVTDKYAPFLENSFVNGSVLYGYVGYMHRIDKLFYVTGGINDSIVIINASDKTDIRQIFAEISPTTLNGPGLFSFNGNYLYIPCEDDNSFSIYKSSYSFPSDVWLELGTPDNTYEWNHSGDLTSTENISVNISLINSLLPDCSCTGCSKSNGNCTIPFMFSSDEIGDIHLTTDFNITYNKTNSSFIFNFSQSEIVYDSIENGSTYVCIENDTVINITAYNFELNKFNLILEGINNSGYPEDLRIDLFDNGTEEVIYPGTINGTRTYVRKFTNGKKEENLTFLTSGCIIRSMNYSANKPGFSQPYNMSIVLSGFEEDPTQHNFTDYFNNESYIGWSTGHVPYYWIDDFSAGDSGIWAGEYTILADTYVYNSFTATAGSGGGSCCQDNVYTETEYFYSSGINLEDKNQVTMRIVLDSSYREYGVGCACTATCGSSAMAGIKDATTGSYNRFAISNDGDDYNEMVTIRKEGSYLKWYEDGVYVNQMAYDSSHEYEVYSKQVPVTNVAGNIYITLYCGSGGYIYPVNSSGFTSPYEGDLKWNTTVEGELISTIIRNDTATNITRARISLNKLNTAGGSAEVWLSNDDNVTWESTTDGNFHLFNTTGNVLRAKINVTVTDAEDPLIIQSYSVDISQGTISDLTIDIGNDGDTDYNYSGKINETNSPLNISLDGDDFSEYIKINCNNSVTCLVPIEFCSNTAGDLEYKDIEGGQRLNETVFDTDYFNDSNKNVSIRFYWTNNGTINITDIDTRYYGDKSTNLTAHIGSNAFSRLINWFYSPWTLDFIPGTYYWELFPSSRTENDTQPYGQNSTHGIWKVNSSVKHSEGVNVYVKLNESLNYSCVTDNTFTGYNYTNVSYINVSLTTSPKILFENLTNQTGYIWTYTDINCSSGTQPFSIPYFCFFSICGSCVQTPDWNDTCDVYE